MRLRYLKLLSVATMLSTTPVFAEGNLGALDDISFEDLGNIVTSVSKRPEDPFKSAAAIFVITQEDIRLSGATHIAEALRMVPGLEVARVDSSNWAITSRGFNDQFANKLLVVVDGRTVYTPLFSGVYWDIQDVVMEDVDRIEVIRGPGAALWGANAVNGVINIITKRAEKTQGVYVSQLIGTEDRTITSTRYGGSIGDNTFYRAYAKYAERRASETTSGDNGGNNWDSGKAGFRTDVEVSPTRKITVQGDFYDADISINNYPPSSSSPFFTFSPDKIDSRGANVLGRWTESHGNGMESTFQAYYDYQSPDYSLLKQDIHTFDLDYQTSWAYNSRNQIVWGAGYRLVSDEFEGTPTLSLTPDSRDTSLYSAFLQDTIAIVPKKVDLTLGSKFEHNDYTGFEVQPNARLAWYPTNNQTVWASVTRAVRTPSRAEDDIQLNAQYVSAYSAIVQQQGNSDLGSETLIAYELGYRIRPIDNLSFDIATFINDYNNLRTLEFGTPSGGFLPVVAQNLGEGQAYGFELASTWDVTDRWSLKGAYTYTDLSLENDPSSTDLTLQQEEGKIPKHQFNIRSNLRMLDNVELVNIFYYVDRLPLYGIESYLRFDTGIIWKVADGVEFSLVGQNLLDTAHQEFGAPLHGQANQIERALYARVVFRY